MQRRNYFTLALLIVLVAQAYGDGNQQNTEQNIIFTVGPSQAPTNNLVTLGQEIGTVTNAAISTVNNFATPGLPGTGGPNGYVPISALINTNGNPTNDLCGAAFQVTLPTTPVRGTTTGATPDPGFLTCGGSNNVGDSVWYRFIGRGRTVSIDTCISNFATQITVYCGSCDNPICITGNRVNPACLGVPNGNPQGSRVSFCAKQGQNYLVRVHSASANSSLNGNFQLNLVEGDTCTPICPLGECAPQIVAPPPGTFRCNQDIRDLSVTGNPTVTPLGTPFTFTDQTVQGCCPNSFSILRTFAAEAACGSVATAQQVISVVDLQAPQLSAGFRQVGDRFLIQCNVQDNCDNTPIVTAKLKYTFRELASLMPYRCISRSNEIVVRCNDIVRLRIQDGCAVNGRLFSGASGSSPLAFLPGQGSTTGLRSGVLGGMTGQNNVVNNANLNNLNILNNLNNINNINNLNNLNSLSNNAANLANTMLGNLGGFNAKNIGGSVDNTPNIIADQIILEVTAIDACKNKATVSVDFASTVASSAFTNTLPYVTGQNNVVNQENKAANTGSNTGKAGANLIGDSW